MVMPSLRVAMPLVRHPLPGQEFLGAVQFGRIPRMPEDARYPGFARSVPGGLADLPDHQRVSGPAAVQYRQCAVVPHNLQRQQVTVERQRAVKVTNLQIDTEEPGQRWCVVCHHLLIPGQAGAHSNRSNQLLLMADWFSHSSKRVLARRASAAGTRVRSCSSAP